AISRDSQAPNPVCDVPNETLVPDVPPHHRARLHAAFLDRPEVTANVHVLAFRVEGHSPHMYVVRGAAGKKSIRDAAQQFTLLVVRDEDAFRVWGAGNDTLSVP